MQSISEKRNVKAIEVAMKVIQKDFDNERILMFM